MELPGLAAVIRRCGNVMRRISHDRAGKIKRARTYMEKLANGVNPLDDTLAPDEDIINQVRLSRCVFFVSDVLRQVIENGGIGLAPASPKPPKPQKCPFALPIKRRNRFAYSEEPISISEIGKRINALVDSEDMQKCSYKDILAWLIALGMMEWVALPDGKRTRRPTEAGRKMGISVVERNGDRGPYQTVVYDVSAQRFIVENLDAIRPALRTQTELQGTPWIKAHDDCLIDLYQKSVPISEIAVTLKRSTSAIRKRLKRLGLTQGDSAV